MHMLDIIELNCYRARRYFDDSIDVSDIINVPCLQEIQFQDCSNYFEKNF